MPIDPNIPLGIRPAQLENPMNALAQAQQFGLNNLKMQEAEQIMQERNALRGLDINAPDYISQVGRVNPKLALELQQGQQKVKTGQVELEAKLMANARNTLAPINDQGTYDLWRQQTSAQLPGIAQFLPAKFDDKVKTSLMLEADKYIAQTQLSKNQQETLGIQKGQLGVSQGNLKVAQENQKLQYGSDVVANTVTDSAGNVTQFNRFGEVIGKPGAVGKPSATFEKTAAMQKQQGKDLTLAITELENATKDKGLIDQSTGSGIGRLVDVAAGFAGQATPGAIAIAKLKPIADMALKMVPRFEGPQSDKDTQSYKEAAGQLADPSLPTDLRKAAGKEVLRLMKARKGQFVNEAMANEGIGASGVDTSNPLLK
jgi:hypothetical protein